MFLRLLPAVLLTFVLANSAVAQVQISSVDKNFQNGVPITISGSGFGTKEFSTPWIWDDLSHPSYSNLSNGDWIPVSDDNSYGPADYPIDPNALYKETNGFIAYRDIHPNLRVPGQAMYSVEGNMGSIFGIGRPHNDTNYLFLDYWYFSTSIRTEPVDGTLDGALVNKMARISPSSSTYNLHGHTSIYPSKLSYDRGDGPKGYSYAPTMPTEGEWTHISIWVDSSGHMSGVLGESEGIFQVRVNNALKTNISDQGYKLVNPPADVMGYTFVHSIGPETGGVANSNHSPPYANLFGDIYIDNTQARVALGDAPTWSQVQHYELQIPQSWQSQSIQVAGNLGSFSPTESVWLYVFDAAGNVNGSGILVDTDHGTPTNDGPGQPGQPSLAGS